MKTPKEALKNAIERFSVLHYYRFFTVFRRKTRKKEGQNEKRPVFHFVPKALAVIAVFGMAVCITLLIPPVQAAILKLIMTRRPLSMQGQSRFFALLSLPLAGFTASAVLFCCVFAKKIASIAENPKNESLFSRAGLGLTVLLLAFITVFSYQHGRQWINSDHSAEIILGNLLAEENALVSPHWKYSTEIRLVYQTLFFMPLFKLLGNLNNWALIRAITILLNNIVLVASYIFMMKQTKAKNKWIWLTSFFLLLPLSIGYWDIVTFGGYYVFFIAQLFCCLGLFLKLVENSAPAKSGKPCFVLFGLVSFMLGAQGIRSLLCVHLPLMLTCFCALRFNRQKKLPLCLGVYGFLLCGAGFFVNYVLHIKYRFHSYGGMLLDDLYRHFSEKLGQNISRIAEFFGYVSGEPLLSARGIFGIAALFFSFWILFSAIKLSKLHDSKNQQFVPLFFICSMAFNIFVFQIIDDRVTLRYFFPFMVFFVPIFVFMLERTEPAHSRISQTAVRALFFLFVFAQSFLNFQNLWRMDNNSIRNGYLDYLTEHKLTYGFATFWNANVTTELSNGAIEIMGLESDGLEPDKRSFKSQWLNPVKFDNPSYHEGESFLLLTKSEWELAYKTGRPFAQKKPDYEDGAFLVLRYPSAAIIHKEVLD